MDRLEILDGFRSKWNLKYNAPCGIIQPRRETHFVRILENDEEQAETAGADRFPFWKR